MSLSLLEAIAIAATDGDRLITTGSVLVSNSVVISFSTALPRTWEYLGTMHREVLINGNWTIISSHRLIPGRPNLFAWEDTAPYRLSFRLVKYIYAGNLLIYGYDAPSPLELAAVAYSGDYLDLVNVPTPFLPYTYIGSELPASPANAETWQELDSSGLIVENWQWRSGIASWVSIARETFMSDTVLSSSTVTTRAVCRLGFDNFVHNATAFVVRGSTALSPTSIPTYTAILKNITPAGPVSTALNVDMGKVSGPTATFRQNAQNFRRKVELNHLSAGVTSIPHPRGGITLEMVPNDSPVASTFFFSVEASRVRV